MKQQLASLSIEPSDAKVLGNWLRAGKWLAEQHSNRKHRILRFVHFNRTIIFFDFFGQEWTSEQQDF